MPQNYKPLPDSLTIKESDIVFIAVGTPQKNSGDVDLHYVESVSKTISEAFVAPLANYSE